MLECLKYIKLARIFIYFIPKERMMKFLRIIAITVLTLASYQAQAWEYRTRTDQMRGTTTRFAEATSTNKVNFGAPYAGGSTLDLTVRERSQDGLNILFTISKGQFKCSDGCKFFARFDDGKVLTIAATGSSSGSMDTIFVENEAPFLAELRNSRRLIVEMEFFQEGSNQFTFNTANLKW
jgi:hypothetical protein